MKQKILRVFLVLNNRIDNGRLVIIQREEDKRIINTRKILVLMDDIMNIQMPEGIRESLLSIQPIREHQDHILMQGNLNQAQTPEPMILKMIGTKR